MELLKAKRSVILVPQMDLMEIAVLGDAVLFVEVVNAKGRPINASLTIAVMEGETAAMLKFLKMPLVNSALVLLAVAIPMPFALPNTS